MDKALRVALDSIDEQSSPIKSKQDIEHVATISANGDKHIGSLVSMAVDQAGKDGAITVQEARSLDTTLEVVEGFQFASGYIASAFVTDERLALLKYEEPYVLITDSTIKNVEPLLPILEQVAREGKPLVVIAETVQDQALAALIMNTVRGSMKVAAIKAPQYGEDRREILRDLAIATGATFVSKETGLSLADVRLEHLGSAASVEASKSWTTIIGGGGSPEEVERRIELLKAEASQSESNAAGEKIYNRVTRLASGIAIIKVGGSTEIEMVEKKHRIEDALEAVRSAQEAGIVPGGGVTLLVAAQALESVDVDNPNQELGVRVVREAMSSPIRQMASNAGNSPDLVVSEVLNHIGEGIGYNFATGELVPMVERGIIDPAKVTKNALQNAVSAAGTLITTDHAIIETS